jgi:hypothetical protein
MCASHRVSAVLPWLYLMGISTGNMSEALSVDAKGLSANERNAEEGPRSLLAFYDFATVRHCTTRTRNRVSRLTFLVLAFKVIEEAGKTCRGITSLEQINLLFEGVAFKDGEPVQSDQRVSRNPQLDVAGHQPPIHRLDIVSCKRSPRPILMTNVSPL